MKHLFCFGLGYAAMHLVENLETTESGWRFSGTSRSEKTLPNIKTYIYEDLLMIPQDVTHVLISIPPNETGDLVYQRFANQITKLQNLEWIGYLSTTGVYGDTKGEVVDESSPLLTIQSHSINRIRAEKQWLQLCVQERMPVHIFRLSGIYGVGRSVIERALTGKLVIINQNDQVFSRIHVQDIASLLIASINKCTPGEIYNVSDDYPCNPKEVAEYACNILDIKTPAPIALEDADLNEMGRAFYSQSRRVSNKKAKKQLDWCPQYPTYKEGLHAIYSVIGGSV